MKKIIPILMLAVSIIPIIVSAEEIINPIAANSFQEIIDGIINFIFYIGLIVTPLMVVIAGLLILTAGGDPKKVEQGRHIIVYALIGLFIILFAKGIISMLNGVMQVKS
jgi:hypothetical protein